MHNPCAPHHTVVIGGSSGLGIQTVELLSKQGHLCSVIGRTPATQILSSSRSRYQQCDITKPKNVSLALSKVFKSRGPVSNLVFFQRYRGSNTSLKNEFSTAVIGTASVIDKSVELFPESGGSIIVISSVNSLFVTPNLAAGYHIAKAALNQLARVYAVKLGSKNIRVNCISPGTLLKKNVGLQKTLNYKKSRKNVAYSPLRRPGTGLDLASLVAFLCSEPASYITGNNIILDGGSSLIYQEALF